MVLILMNKWMIEKDSMRHHNLKILKICIYMEDITDADYMHTKRVCNDFQIKKFKRISFYYMFKAIHYC